jgi:hypothetical protein
MQCGKSLPAVDLYQLGFGYYVVDGHHRVAAARQLGQLEIEANVVEFVSSARGGCHTAKPSRTELERVPQLLVQHVHLNP